MAPPAKIALEQEDHKRDADFMKAMHGKSTEAAGGFAAMLSKDKDAKKLAVDEYFKHFDDKRAETETDADREVRSPPGPIATARTDR
jgi:sterol 24-C-methyltransferase